MTYPFVDLRKVNNLSEMVFYFIIYQTDHSPRNTFVVRKQRYEMNIEYIQYTGNEHGLWEFLIHLHRLLENTIRSFPVTSYIFHHELMIFYLFFQDAEKLTQKVHT